MHFSLDLYSRNLFKDLNDELWLSSLNEIISTFVIQNF